MRYQEMGVGSTVGDGQFVRLWTSAAMPENGTWHIEAAVVGTSLSAGEDRHGSWVLDAAFASTAGKVSRIGEPHTICAFPTHVGMALEVGCNRKTRIVFIEARDDGVAAMKFAALVVRLEIV